MGEITYGIPTELALRLRDQYHARTFVETGTYQGDTAWWAASHFGDVFTIEQDRELYLRAAERLRPVHVFCFKGDSRELLRVILPLLQPARQPVLFWLDAHWTEQGEAEDRCPVLDELDLILHQRPPGDVILIDDARFFLSAPELPRPDYWPSYGKIAECVQAGPHPRSMTIVDDVILILPSIVANL